MTVWSTVDSESTLFGLGDSLAGQYYLLMETGSYILLETGDKIFLENNASNASAWSSVSTNSTVWT